MAHENVQPGDVVGEYRIVEKMGMGGFAFVYIAERISDGARVVVKTLHHLAAKHDSTAYERFQREAKVAIGLEHPNIVRTLDYGRMDNDQLYLVMEHIDGRPLDEVMKAGPMRPENVARIIEELLSALDAAHRQAIVHRDLKPTNILLVGSSNDGHIKVIDFGLAKVLEGTDDSVMKTLTALGTVVGTPGYLSPEVLHGESVTPQFDLYAAGIIGWELLAGEIAYKGKPLERVHAQAAENPPPLPPPVQRHYIWPVLSQLMARDVNDRFRTAAVALEYLANLRQNPASLRPVKKPWWRFW